MTESDAKGFIQGKLDCMKKCDVFDKEGNISDNDCDNCEYCYSQGNFGNQKEAFQMAIKALEQEPKMEQFAKWVAEEIIDDMWEYNKDSFAEIACRKLAKLGIVRAKGDEWELVESQESEVEHGKMNLDEYGNLEEPCLSCDKTYMNILSYEWCCDEKECPYTVESEEG